LATVYIASATQAESELYQKNNNEGSEKNE